MKYIFLELSNSRLLMPTIAKKLCHDIVEPILRPSSIDARKLNSSGKSANSLLIVRKDLKPKQTIQIEKKKIVTKIDPTHVSDFPTNKLKSRENIIKKNLANSAVNTLISGPLRCDNNCSTLIHKRDHRIYCTCNKRKLKGSSKEIQTFMKNNSISNKACTQYVETVSCGTQFIDNLNGILMQSFNKHKPNITINLKDNINKLKTKITTPLVNKENVKFDLVKPHVSKPPSLIYVSGKHWAVSNYPTRGPDF